MEIILVPLLTLLLFMATILLLASKPKFAGRLTSIFIFLAGAGGLFFYGYGFAVTIDNFWLATMRALLAVCRMFVGGYELGSISEAPLMRHSWMHLLFWIVHFLALYSLCSAAITSLGAGALRRLRLWLSRRGTLHVIYGVSDDTVALGRELLQQKQGSVVFVDSSSGAANAAAIADIGCVLRCDSSAICADSAFIRSSGMGRSGRKIHVYAMERLSSDNLRYARQLLDSMKAAGISPRQTELVIRARENAATASLQALGEQYGYGAVTAFQQADLAARTLIRNYPPCKYMSFDADGKATEDFEALIIGFGQVGQSVLRSLVMNGQFEASTFHASVFAPDCNSAGGYFFQNYGQLPKQYDISFHAFDGRSQQLYDHLAQRGKKLKYLAICISDETISLEIAENLTDHLQTLGLDIPIFRCDHRGVSHFNAPDGKTLSLYRPEVLSMKNMDHLAMLVNNSYQSDQTKTPWQHWLNCDYFSRMSCRAMADFIPAMLRIAGTTSDKAAQGWSLTDAQLDNMSKTEHLRWCAFHFCMGFSPMSAEEYDAREAKYLQQTAAGEKPLRVGKNIEGRTHACLIGWDALDDLSARESRLTGKPLDYKKMDTDNVLLIPKLLNAQ